ncbi:S9 family peptidase [Chryseomicrobium palamuruense]|uniref:S9 family peptidase n=1 Tax=Chryseomicrobium palamuruense TaxID=682973 RepID=A0ABV8URL0_9BACL
MVKTKLTANDLFDIHSVTAPVISPDGQRVAYITTTIDEKKNTYFSKLWVTQSNGAQKSVAWTTGEERISNVTWSPSGNHLSFLSTRNEKNQLFVLSAHGGEAQKITSLPFGVQSYEWDPSETKLWFTATYHEEHGWEDEKKDDKKDDFPKPYIAGKMKYIQDGNGLVKQDRFNQIGTVNIDTKEVSKWSDTSFSQHLHTISPDGKKFVVSEHPKEDDDVFENTLYLVDVDSKERQELTQENGSYYGARFSPDGNYIGFIGSHRTYENATHADLYVYAMEQQAVQNLTESVDAPVGDYVVADIQQGASAPSLVWTEENHVYFQVSTHGDVRIYMTTLEGEMYPVTQEGEHVYGYDVSKDGKHLVLTVSSPVSPGEVYTQTVATGERTPLSAHNAEFLSTKNIYTPEPIIFEGPNGWEVHGWIIRPEEAKNKKVPLVTNIHGGPHAFYANTFFHEMQLLANKGYGVLYINPRGSHSYSQEFVDAVRGDYGGNDYLDIMAAVDYALETYDWIDKERLGVTGGSYGGFMTNWIVGHTDRFKAAVTQRSISNWISFYGVSDIGFYFTEWQIQGDMNDVEKLWDHSPLKYASQVNTPLLILHGENDLRCPIEQAQQLYITLKRMGKETEFVRFPQADHNLSRTGLPNLRIERLHQITGWFEQYL